MMRRRSAAREIHFSFDSFLDVVANVVGIIIRLILVVWVGARSYSSVQMIAQSKTEPKEAVAASADVGDPLELELAQHRWQLAEAEAGLCKQLELLESLRKQ